MELPEIITEIRRGHNLNRRQFATMLNVQPSTITRWENGERTPGGAAEIGALLQVAHPDYQRALLSALGITDVEQFAIDILKSAGVRIVAR